MFSAVSSDAPPLENGRVYYFFRRPERCVYGRYIGTFAPGWIEVHPINSNQGPSALSLYLTMRIKPEEPFIDDLNNEFVIIRADEPSYLFKETSRFWPTLEIGKSYRFDRECEYERCERGVVVGLDKPAPGWVQIRAPSLAPPYYRINWINLRQCFQVVPDPGVLTILKNIRIGPDASGRLAERPDPESPVETEPYVLYLTREASVEGMLLWAPKPGWVVLSDDGVAKNGYLFNLDLCYRIEPVD